MQHTMISMYKMSRFWGNLDETKLLKIWVWLRWRMFEKFLFNKIVFWIVIIVIVLFVVVFREKYLYHSYVFWIVLLLSAYAKAMPVGWINGSWEPNGSGLKQRISEALFSFAVVSSPYHSRFVEVSPYGGIYHIWRRCWQSLICNCSCCWTIRQWFL